MQHLKLMAVLAHPDDESLGFGGVLARYADEGVETSLVTATQGQRGRFRGHARGTREHPGEGARRGYARRNSTPLRARLVSATYQCSIIAISSWTRRMPATPSGRLRFTSGGFVRTWS